MYLALSLAPWMLMYALSTMAMNHRSSFAANPIVWEKESEQIYGGTFPPGAASRVVAEQILIDLGMEGAFNVAGPSPDGRLTIMRQDLVTPRRIVFSAASGQLVVERQAFRTNVFLERFHRRRGYQQPYALDDIWAFTVDLVILAMVFWVASGLWMWWEMRVTRAWGALFAIVGAGLFAFFLLTI